MNRVENILAIEEIALFEQSSFLLTQFFLKLSAVDALKCVCKCKILSIALKEKLNDADHSTGDILYTYWKEGLQIVLLSTFFLQFSMSINYCFPDYFKAAATKYQLCMLETV